MLGVMSGVLGGGLGGHRGEQGHDRKDQEKLLKLSSSGERGRCAECYFDLHRLGAYVVMPSPLRLPDL